MRHHPHTHNVLREASASRVDAKPPVRAKLRQRMTDPSKGHRPRELTCWKRYRRKQYTLH